MQTSTFWKGQYRHDKVEGNYIYFTNVRTNRPYRTNGETIERMDGCGITGDFSRADQLEVIKYYVAIVEHYVSQIKKPEEESKWKLRKVRPGKWIQGTEDYKKQFYDLLLPDGEIVFYCYPNAWKFTELFTGKEGRIFDTSPTMQMRKSAYSI